MIGRYSPGPAPLTVPAFDTLFKSCLSFCRYLSSIKHSIILFSHCFILSLQSNVSIITNYFIHHHYLACAAGHCPRLFCTFGSSPIGTEYVTLTLTTTTHNATMKSSIASGLLAASSLLSLASADAPGTFSIKIHKNRQVERAQLAKRGTVPVTLANYEQIGLYTANATVGTPGQLLTFQVDTGSSDVWVPSSSAEICKDTKEGGCPFGSCKYHLSLSTNSHDPPLERTDSIR